jgi:hypothetical protein
MAKPEEERFSLVTANMIDAIQYGVSSLHKKNLTTIDPNNITFVGEFIKTLDKHFLIQEFIKKSHMHWNKIKDRDESFFITHASEVFSFLPNTYIAMFTDLFTAVDKEGKKVIKQNLKDDIWDIFDAMVKISIRYTHKKRISEVDFIQNLDVQTHATTWKLQL